MIVLPLIKLQEFYSDLVKTKGSKDKVYMTVCGNKCDLKEGRAVSLEEGREFAAQNDGLFYETSAKANQNVTEAFDAMIRKLREKKPSGEKQKPKGGGGCAIL